MTVAQVNVAFSCEKGTLWGMRSNFPHRAEPTLARATCSVLGDIMVPLRPESPTNLGNLRLERTEDNGRATHGRERFGQGSQTLVDDSKTSFQVGQVAETDGDILCNDAGLQLSGPLPVTRMSEKVESWMPLDEYEAELSRRMSL